MRPEDVLRAQLHGEADETADDLRSRFPDPDNDERLHVPSAHELPPVPDVTFKRPNTQTARGEQAVSRVVTAGPAGTASGVGAGGENDGAYRNMGIASTIGFSLVISIGVGAGLGWLVDRFILHSGAMPWGLIIGFFAGVISGFTNLVRVANRLNR